ncbi:uncharacterized protein A1O9_05736 [Exophiala aquamarina CBS 119918]|uniref:protein-tyrosine-phosphatase n=1 Tax=Exophiala aquamarina CBS 119918 TaxID=1182545 RepID=A0A072PDA7_9EURO|nr:uncharacterized protein A1O9_05736 [Exophiala aquamarina CBS 119918]KEF57816.1 hypothetical protein A1O9_05736 [Exophiala aquamarina CBS 119918]
MFAPSRPGHKRSNLKAISFPRAILESQAPALRSKTTKQKMASTTCAPLFPDQIMPGIYISETEILMNSIQTAQAVLSPNYQAPNRPRIRYILSLLNAEHQQPKMTPGQESDFVLKLILLRDSSTEDLLQALGEACEFIKSSLAKKDGGVLIHCHQGVSRSASVVTAFVMEEMDLEYDTALRYVRGRRPKVNPNKGFAVQLEMWRRLRYTIREESGDFKKEYTDFRSAKNIGDAKAEATKW